MSAIAGASPAPVRPPRTPKCTRCRNHGILVPVRGHSGHCGWKLCNCPKCALITERHKVLAAHKLLRKPGTEEPTPEDGRGRLQYGRGDFRPSYYPAISQYMPSGYLPGLHYMPPTVPMNVSYTAEPERSLSCKAKAYTSLCEGQFTHNDYRSKFI
ncbi:doublesex- and mab-3-related transcription factor B1 [Eleutherodactylus coqui]|uniref:doublesex- and mab-3-related transcription factor B1 n=1 Tax=Eleutherodactylus coqui TaxID=57060 RepID=UPI003462E21B